MASHLPRNLLIRSLRQSLSKRQPAATGPRISSISNFQRCADRVLPLAMERVPGGLYRVFLENGRTTACAEELQLNCKMSAEPYQADCENRKASALMSPFLEYRWVIGYSTPSGISMQYFSAFRLSQTWDRQAGFCRIEPRAQISLARLGNGDATLLYPFQKVITRPPATMNPPPTRIGAVGDW